MSSRFYALVTTIFVLAVCAAFLPRAAAAHTFHTSLMSMEYNRQEQALEITLQVFSHDLEAILSRRSGKSVRLDKTPDAARLVFAYLQDAVNLRNNAGEMKSLEWVGMEMQADSVWLYVESKMPGGLTGAQLRNRVLFDMFEDQVNLVHLKDEARKSDLVFKPGDGFKPLFETAGD
ncbi:MAG TPA: DUF6702 family protein [Pyrinomonadaceae bacterium]|jgi:hypothetical protein